MNKREMAEAMLAGKVLVHDSGFRAFFDASKTPPFRVTVFNGEEPLRHLWDSEHWRILEEPKKRPMTREEILGFVANTPGVVARSNYGDWQIPCFLCFSNDQAIYEWATITPDGKIGEPRKFEKEV